MLKGIDPILSPELLAILRAMGHGDDIAIVDANFPAAANAKRLVRADGVAATDMARAIVALLPLDDFVPAAAFRMAVVGAPDEVPPVIEAFAAILAEAGYERPIEAVERFAFYRQAAEAYAVVATGERRFWGNLILKKGAIPPPQSGGG
ncbi:MAG TPA: RbsD/FucU domain-containing protein [Caulobacteraceae bacterium]|nr:RbsD/FucU domain-containing protein [Caulobacteraceae bacterium]